LRCRGSRGKSIRAAREPKRKAVKIVSTPAPLLNQPLFDLILSPRKGVEQRNPPLHTDMLLMILKSLSGG
jgi:hypothetical protein